MSKAQLEALDHQLRHRPSRAGLSVAAARVGFAAGLTQDLPESISAGMITIGGRSGLQLDQSENDHAERVLLYFHGGGYVVGSPRTHAHLAAALIKKTGGRAVLPDYRLAPENRYPAAVEDGLAAYQELIETVEPGRITIGGDSAGGGLTLAVLLRARDLGLPLPAAAVLFSPLTDATVSGSSYETKVGIDPMFTRERVVGFIDHYLPVGDRTVQDVSPGLHSLAGLPPLLVQVGSHEVLLSDAVLLAERAATDDVDVRLEITAGAPHVFQNYDVDEARAALDRAGRFLAEQLQATQSAQLVLHAQ